MSLIAYKVDQAITDAMRSSPYLLSVWGNIYNSEAPEGMSLPALVFTTDLDIEESFDDTAEEVRGTCEVLIFVGDAADGTDPTRNLRELADNVRKALHRVDVSSGTGLSKCQLMLGDGAFGRVEVADHIYSVTVTFQVFAA